MCTLRKCGVHNPNEKGCDRQLWVCMGECNPLFIRSTSSLAARGSHLSLPWVWKTSALGHCLMTSSH
ncbi:hypothetical protein Y1Q_0015457 [Alligator mississippiensis]|uniref:Uncharacterized protein n=1 Tax=Alligator mississippiensis TaxID=8496 RepID=A0A151ND43_ALLMI|nr:hypothetical protein Y1Q_0015457 [Alligator mississippiensis]